MASSRNVPFSGQNQWKQYVLTKADVAFSGFLGSSPAQFFSPCQECIYPSILMKENDKKKLQNDLNFCDHILFCLYIQIEENIQTKKSHVT